MPRSSSTPPARAGSSSRCVGSGVGAHAVVGGDPVHLSEQPVLEDAAHDVHVRQVPRPHGLHEQHARIGRRGDELARLGGVASEGLLDEHVLAGPQREQRVVPVVAVRARDVDGVDVRTVHERLRRTCGPGRRRARGRTPRPAPETASRSRRAAGGCARAERSRSARRCGPDARIPQRSGGASRRVGRSRLGERQVRHAHSLAPARRARLSARSAAPGASRSGSARRPPRGR